jgi:glycosyltransferase involved in cell wall biosynthesis
MTLHVALDATPLLGQPTGVGEFTRGLLGALAARDDVVVTAYGLTWRGRGALGPAVPRRVVVAGRPMAARPLRQAWTRADHPQLERWTGPVDVVHGTNFVVPPARATQVVTVHDLTPVRFPELCTADTLAYPGLVRRALRRGAWIHTHAESVREEVLEEFGPDGATPDRVVAVPSGIPSAASVVAADPARGRALAGAERYVLALGTVEPRKDLPGLVAAFSGVAAEVPGVRLVIAGPDGWGAEALGDAIDASPVRSRIVRLGFVPASDRDALVRGAAVLAYPSRYEGFGYPPLQAMAAGVPVVSTSAGSLAEVLGDAALVVPAGDVDVLSAGLVTVLTDPAVARRLGAAGPARAAGFSWERCADGLVGVYRAAVSAAGGRGSGPLRLNRVGGAG